MPIECIEYQYYIIDNSILFQITSELRQLEIPADATSAQNHETPLLLKLQQVYSSMASCNSGDKLEVPRGTSQDRKKHR